MQTNAPNNTSTAQLMDHQLVAFVNTIIKDQQVAITHLTNQNIEQQNRLASLQNTVCPNKNVPNSKASVSNI